MTVDICVLLLLLLLRVCRTLVSTALITRSGAAFLAIRHCPSVPCEFSAGSTSWC